jgi:hypothetical protein
MENDNRLLVLELKSKDDMIQHLRKKNRELEGDSHDMVRVQHTVANCLVFTAKVI